MSDAFAPFETKMRDAELPQLAIDTLRYYVEQLRSGERGPGSPDGNCGVRGLGAAPAEAHFLIGARDYPSNLVSATGNSAETLERNHPDSRRDAPPARRLARGLPSSTRQAR